MLAPSILAQAAIALGPVSLSLPELAAALTRAGMPTVCSPSLSERAALVSLRRRSPEAARKAIGEALGIVFKEDGGRWTMTVDPDARRRDARLLAAYKALAAKTAGEWADGERAARGGLGFSEYLAQTRARTLGAKAANSEAAVIKRVAPLVALARHAQPNTWAAVAALRDPAFVGQAIELGTAVRTIPADRLERTTGLPLAAYGEEARSLGVDLARATSLSTRAVFDPLRGTLTLSSSLMVGDRALYGAQTFEAGASGNVGNDRSAYETTVGLESDGVSESFAAMGADASAYLASLAPSPVLPDAPRLLPAPWTLSLALERLCADGQDVVMALSPRFEYVPRLRRGEAAPVASFRSVFAPVPGGFDAIPDYGYSARQQGLDAAGVAARRGREARRRAPWRVADRDGVWLVVNPYGFLDRLRPVSPVPFLQIERALQEQDGKAWPTITVPTVATARKMLRAMSFGRMSELYELLNYRDMGLENTLGLLRLTEVVAAADVTAATAFWRELWEKGEAEITAKGSTIFLRLDEPEGPPNIVGGYLFPHRQGGGADLGYVRFDGRGSVLP